jgi:ABC-type Fe3+ transport system permease subunit
MEAASVFIVLFGGGGGLAVWYYYLLARHKERMLLIEKGADAKLFKSEPRTQPYFIVILLGIIFICIGLSIGFGYLLSAYLYSIEVINYHANPMPYFFVSFLMLGIGFILSFFLHKRLLSK